MPYTLSEVEPGSEEAVERSARRWWVAALLVNALTTGIAAAAVLGPRNGAAWAGLLPILTAPMLLIPIALRQRGRRRARSIHRARPKRFPRP
ncbi:hypothetical protein ACE7GA_23650 [Roseomonas sp. CCTCC AB2023176]|uniref:hypothetical protein n=1 Tax=Roseomonas sp. CCTCC AB2023176 TaxID=3342640 RepID=UPI0035D76FC4